MNRRELIRSLACTAGVAPVLTCAGQLFAAPRSSARFLLVFLRGGYDCASLLIPYGSTAYYDSRPRIAIPPPRTGAASGALALDSDWALAPAVCATVGPMYERREVAFIPFAGSDDTSRSHFETQDALELGQPLGGTRDYRSGFLARLVTELNGAAPIAFTDTLPLVFRGGVDVPNISLKALDKPAFDARQAGILQSMYAGHRLQAAVADGLELRQEVARAMEDEMLAANRSAVTTKGFELEAARIGRLMREQYNVGFVDVGGWDTHVNQGADRGVLATSLENLSRGLRTFADTLGSEWTNTIVLVVSEFGRTFRENGNGGTDHGHGSVYWVLGGNLRGGLIAGAQVRVSRETLFQDRDYPVLNQYRAVLAGLARPLWDLSPTQIERVFPGAEPVNLGLI